MLDLTTVARGSAQRDSWWVEEFHGEAGLVATVGNLIVVTDGLPADCRMAVGVIREAIYAGSPAPASVGHAVGEAARVLAEEPGAQVSAVAVLLRPSGGVEVAGSGSCTAYHFVRRMGRLERLTDRTAARARLGDRDPQVGTGGAQLERGDLVVVVSGGVLGSVTDAELEVIAGEAADLGPDTGVEMILERVSRRDQGARVLAVMVGVGGDVGEVPVAPPPAQPGRQPDPPQTPPFAEPAPVPPAPPPSQPRVQGLPLGGRRSLPPPPPPAVAGPEATPAARPVRRTDETDDAAAASTTWGAGPGTGAAAAAAAFMASQPPPPPPVSQSTPVSPPPQDAGRVAPASVPAGPVPRVPDRGPVEPVVPPAAPPVPEEPAAEAKAPGGKRFPIPGIPLPKVTRGNAPPLPAPAPPPSRPSAPGRRRGRGLGGAIGGAVSGLVRFVLLTLAGLALAAVVVILGFLAINLWDGAITFGPGSSGQVRSLEEGDLFTRPFVRVPGQVSAQTVTDGRTWQEEVDGLWAQGDAGDVVALRRIVDLLERADATEPADPARAEKLRVARTNLVFRQRMAEAGAFWPQETSADTILNWTRAVETLEALVPAELPAEYRRQLTEKLYAGHVNLARALDSAGRRFEATGHLQRARQLDPARPEANDLLASRS